MKIQIGNLRILNALGLSDRRIAEELGVSQSGVSRARQRIGLDPNFEIIHINGTSRNPMQIYDSALSGARDWKSKHPVEVRKQIREWQMENRKWRNEYERGRRKRK